MAIEKISENKRKQIINKSVNPLPDNPSKAGYKADEIKKAMFNFVTDEKDSVVDEINRIVDETNASFDDIDNTNQETSKTIESINNTIKQINDTVSDKVDKEEGKHLSSNDFSSEEKEKLARLNNYDDSEVRADINKINSKIPVQASSSNKLADKDFVNSSIETATATFKGTFEDLDLLKATSADNNDYAFYDHISNSNRVFDRYKYNGTEWVYEYTLNNSSFTDAQWKAINSGATVELINQILTNADNINIILSTLNDIDTKLNDTVDKISNQDISGSKNFTNRPTVNKTEVALKTDLVDSLGTVVTVGGESVSTFNADTKLDKNANASSATKATYLAVIPARGSLDRTIPFMDVDETNKSAMMYYENTDYNFTYNAYTGTMKLNKIEASGDISDAMTGKYCTAKSNNTVTYPYHRIAYIENISTSYYDADIILLISKGYDSGGFGICRLTFRTNCCVPTSTTASKAPSMQVRWLATYNLTASDISFNLNYDNTTSNDYGTIYKNISCDVFYKITGIYDGIVFKELLSDYRSTPSRRWSLVTSYDNTSTNYSECWTTQAEASTALRGSDAKTTGTGANGGTVNFATYANYIGTTPAVTSNNNQLASTAWVRSVDSVALNTTRTNQHDTVVSYKISEDGLTWYRIWASGWKECGCTITYDSAGDSDNVNLPVTFTTVNDKYVYTVEITVNAQSTSTTSGSWAPRSLARFIGFIVSRSASSFTFQHNNGTYFVYCCGF